MAASPKRKPTTQLRSSTTTRSATTRSTTTRSTTKRSAIVKSAGRAKLKAVKGDVVESVPELDGVIHERARLAIVSALVTSDATSHTELRDLLNLTDGNLSVHAGKLEDAGYISSSKQFSGKAPRTTYRLTAAGRRAFERYISHLEQLLKVVRKKG